MKLFNLRRITSITSQWGGTKAPPYQMGVILAGQPIGFFNYGFTYAGETGAAPPVVPPAINIPQGQPIGLSNYGITYSGPVT